jgi:hypothetical protein
MYSITPQTIFVPDEHGSVFSVPLITADVVRQVLRCRVRDDNHRLRLEIALIRKYFPLAVSDVVVPDTPRVAEIVQIIPKGQDKKTEDDQVKKTVKYLVVDQPPPVQEIKFPEKRIQGIQRMEIQRSTVVKVSNVPVKKKTKIPQVDLASQRKVRIIESKFPNPLKEGGEYVEGKEFAYIKTENQNKRFNFIDISAENSETEIENSVEGNVEVPKDIRNVRKRSQITRTVEEVIEMSEKKENRNINVVEGQIKHMKSYYIDSLKIKVMGPFERGRMVFMTKRNNNGSTEWEHYLTRDLICPKTEILNLTIKNEDKEPTSMDVNGFIIRQIQARIEMEGKPNQVVKVRIKAELVLIGWQYSHYERK